MNIFLIEDNVDLNRNIEVALTALGHNISAFTDGQQALNNISKEFDLYIIDIMIPHVNGLLLLKTIKKLNSEIPCFIISGDTEIDTIINAYEIGADDFIKKPFDLQELEAKIRRISKYIDSLIQLTKSCYYDLDKKVLFVDNEAVELTNKENNLLYLLVKNIGTTVPTIEIENFVWGESLHNGHTRQLVSKLRKKLPCDIIKNHAGNGYKINKHKT